MYADTMLFFIGAIGALGALFSLGYLIFASRRHRSKIAPAGQDQNYVLTELSTEHALHNSGPKQTNAFSEKTLEGLYTIEKSIYSGPMSEVFLAKSQKLDNKCIIKFVTHEIGNLSYEHEKLKNLYHTGLPKI
ncbi:MAG: hypothetical protein FWD23_10635, partial [Oscillospiraceae bacterium]|nr:hypothetical protein [Oscillospiraceae bacterium]